MAITMFGYRVSLATVAAAWSFAAVAQGFVAIWAFEDRDGSFTLQLRPDRSCLVVVHSSALDRGSHIPCTYWVHGSRINLRVREQRIGEGLGKMDLEYVPQSDTVIVHGEGERVLRRRRQY